MKWVSLWATTNNFDVVLVVVVVVVIAIVAHAIVYLLENSKCEWFLSGRQCISMHILVFL